MTIVEKAFRDAANEIVYSVSPQHRRLLDVNHQFLDTLSSRKSLVVSRR